MTEDPSQLPFQEYLQNSTVVFPVLRYDSPNNPIGSDVLHEIQRAAKTTYEVLGISTTQYQHGIRFEDLVDINTVNENDMHTFPRRENTDMNMLAIIVTTFPVYDKDGQETIALMTKDNLLFLNLRRIDDQFITDEQETPIAIKVGIAVVEEVIHHIQHTVYGRPFVASTKTMKNISEHMKDATEKEAAQLRKQVYKVLYPDMNIRIYGIDF